MDNQSVIYQVTQQPTRKTGIANVHQAMAHAGVSSRTTLIAWEREGKFPPRVSLGGNRVGWRWSDLYAWADSLTAKEGTKNGQ
ncbi:helix-turn-helix transcriptional regulator [Thiothrix nivea]|uniref:Prophage CP4-57 regulatory n=1 Tax=Thiothrix nivea (strain ATCC 35100 / DSM 5205 / JP2) TaxID=870187 RepID=A0A656HCU0_THINJ|nr:AlpA family phage regulatory protein [Thiothrix nivea]EIJ34698.1 Prophage CP4-57 regulatory [Thiothrix nivea DSM 5205]